MRALPFPMQGKGAADVGPHGPPRVHQERESTIPWLCIAQFEPIPSMRHEFPIDPDLIYLNHAAVSPWPRRTAEAVRLFAEDNLHRGSLHYPDWLECELRLRERLARLINAPAASNIALLKSTSEGLSTVAYGMDWRPGDTVVLPAGEFPSNRVVWESLASQGVTVNEVDVRSADDPEAALIDALDSSARLLSVSAVNYVTGLRLDLERLGQACRVRDVYFCVDAIQWLGALPFDLQRIPADFVVADGHKWMLGPEGTALFYCRPDLYDSIHLRQYGWHMLEHAGDYDRKQWQPANEARRFECGSPNMLGIHALEASLSLLEEVGIGEVARAIDQRVSWLIDALSGISGAKMISSTDPTRRAGIVTFRIEGTDSATLHRHLMKHGVQCAQRGGGVRLSPHFYTPQSHLKKTLNAIKGCL